MLELDKQSRNELWASLTGHIENYLTGVKELRLAPDFTLPELSDVLAEMDLSKGMSPLDALHWVNQQLTQFQVHTPHPRYFGLFNPASSTMGIAADALVATFNPQLAAWSHSPFANELEQWLIKAFAQRFGYPSTSTDGTFTSGGAEANHTALLTALVHHFPDFKQKGLLHIQRQPVLYVSEESHHSLGKAAASCGLGIEGVRQVPVNDKLSMEVSALEAMIAQDIDQGKVPFMLVATAGTTNAGAIDPINDLAQLAERYGLWFHVDAAWGGAAVLSHRLKSTLLGIGRADSITFDAHKWLSVPMGAGMYLTRHVDILSKSFSIQADYMPTRDQGDEVVNPFMHTLQWSRRFIGLKVFLSLAVAGWEGYAKVIDHQVAMGNYLREKLQHSNWEITGETPLPIVCFSDPGISSEEVARQVVARGRAWISSTRLSNQQLVLRACITNFKTQQSDIDILIEELELVRASNTA